MDDIATGRLKPKLQIRGRPKPGCHEQYVILEEPGQPVQMHWRGRQVPHMTRNCPHCSAEEDDRYSVWYVGAQDRSDREVCILELNEKCFRSAENYARHIPVYGDREASGFDLPHRPVFVALIVEIHRSKFAWSPRLLRCQHRAQVSDDPWPFNTRVELARIWGIARKPRLYREETA